MDDLFEVIDRADDHSGDLLTDDLTVAVEQGNNVKTSGAKA